MRCAAPIVLVGALAGCDGGELLQGEPYAPFKNLPIDPASVRDGAPACGEDARCEEDGGTSLPLRDAGPDADPPAAPTNTCTTARDLGTVAGDAPSTPLVAEGTCAEYVRVRVTEQDNGALGRAMRVRVGLSPAGHDFDLYAFLDPGRDELACGSPHARAETNGNTAETISLSWGEGSIANGNDDSRTLVLAVASASGPCPPGATWNLTITGNP